MHHNKHLRLKSGGGCSKMSAARHLIQESRTIENHLRDKKKLSHQDTHQETFRRLQRCAGVLELDWPASVEERPLGRALVLDPAPPIPCLAAHCLPYGFSRSSPGRRPTTRLASLVLTHLLLCVCLSHVFTEQSSVFHTLVAMLDSVHKLCRLRGVFSLQIPHLLQRF